MLYLFNLFFFFKQKTAYEMRISDWSSDVCSSDLNGLLFIQTQNNGSDSRYHAELADVGGDILNIISDHDLAIVTDMSFAEANAMLSAIAAEYNEGSCLSFAAMFIKHNGQIAAAWWGGQDGKIMSDDQHAVHVML